MKIIRQSSRNVFTKYSWFQTKRFCFSFKTTNKRIVHHFINIEWTMEMPQKHPNEQMLKFYTLYRVVLSSVSLNKHLFSDFNEKKISAMSANNFFWGSRCQSAV